MTIKPLREGRVSIKDQAIARGVALPLNKTVAELKKLGFDVDSDWALVDIFVEAPKSPTGYGIASRFNPETAIYALAV